MPSSFVTRTVVADLLFDGKPLSFRGIALESVLFVGATYGLSAAIPKIQVQLGGAAIGAPLLTSCWLGLVRLCLDSPGAQQRLLRFLCSQVRWVVGCDTQAPALLKHNPTCMPNMYRALVSQAA